MKPKKTMVISRKDLTASVPADEKMERADQIVEMLTDLPALPQVATQALELLDDPKATMQKIADHLRKDPAIVSHILRMANSPVFYRGRESTTILQAVTLIGFGNVRALVTAAAIAAVQSPFSGPRKEEFEAIQNEIWRNSLCTALGSKLLAERLKRPYLDEAFLYGLLHDLGKFAFMLIIPDDFADVLKARKGRPLVDRRFRPVDA